ncbi:MAG TPA: hypothetical protein VFW73_08895 [Lacipirellulaceae bacterium]|nr:hypothetical protein [Lacipirellulaceae bacterium]
MGAAGGFAGTVALQALLTASQKWLPSAAPPLRQHPGEFMVKKAEASLPEAVRRRIPTAVETSMAQALGVGYGLAFGALYAAVRPKRRSFFVDGLMLGSAAWAAGYLGWLPALGVMRPVGKHYASQALAPVAEHAVYGVVTVAVCDWLQDRLASTGTLPR